MAVTFIDLKDTYNIKTKIKDIIVDVSIGDGQSGDFTISLGKQLIEINKPATMGKQDDVKGKKTIVSVKVDETLTETNRTSMTVTVTEGARVTTYGPYKHEVAQHLDSVVYTLKLSNQ
ncbi:MAG: hypothetical protein ABIR78_07355 [Ferruginibacter sp.]